MNTNEIILYQTDTLSSHIEVRIEDETVWLTQMQMVDLFNATKQNISLHINNIFKEGELQEDSVVKYSLTTAADGKKYKNQNIQSRCDYFGWLSSKVATRNTVSYLG